MYSESLHPWTSSLNPAPADKDANINNPILPISQILSYLLRIYTSYYPMNHHFYFR